MAWSLPRHGLQFREYTSYVASGYSDQVQVQLGRFDEVGNLARLPRRATVSNGREIDMADTQF